MAALKYNQEELYELLKQFHNLTGMIFTLYDNEGLMVTCYPKNDCKFCHAVSHSVRGSKRCKDSDRASFEASKKSGECVIYTCHAGLVEATAPIINDTFIIGYLMLGQVSNSSSRRILERQVQKVFHENEIYDTDWRAAAAEIPIHSDLQIQAAAKIMESCISYILYKNLISIQRQTFEKKINDFILSHLSGDLSVDSLCEELKISRRKLYQYSDQFLHCSIARHIKTLRIAHAKHLLKDTALPVAVISERCGFTDYNYFCRIFKQEVGMSARAFRQKI